MTLEEHLLLPRDQICEVTEAPPVDHEDGITEEIARNLLYGRNTAEETTWGGVWTLLFPDDPEVPDSDFNPVAELVEVEQAFDEGQEMLKEGLREKLKLLLPEALDADYLSFLTGQLELVFETHKVNVMKQSLGRCCSTVSGAQPSRTQRTEHPSPPRKPNRRSRRSIVLQNIHHSSIQDPTPGPASRRTSHIASSTANRPANRPFSEQSFLCRTEPQRPMGTARTTGNASPPVEEYPLEHALEHPIGHPLKQHPPNQHLHNIRHSPNPDPNPRDSRDSGISMPCDACASEPCTCAATVHKSQTETDAERAGDDGDGKWGAAPEDQDRNARLAAAAFPRRSRLSIQTADLHLHRRSGGVEGWDGDAEGGSGGGGGGEGGGFSPESFKQRVLRGQLMGV
ncbi:hypothetical protein B0I37DRAFT_315097 [Chaetomium sp. MPI-CAGE-AT-0009]|nr:hypothetical protein B0I37DRAFT_315097 [Chaetomium sp. MPI-CAGE-AT-0009]